MLKYKETGKNLIISKELKTKIIICVKKGTKIFFLHFVWLKSAATFGHWHYQFSSHLKFYFITSKYYTVSANFNP